VSSPALTPEHRTLLAGALVSAIERRPGVRRGEIECDHEVIAALQRLPPASVKRIQIRLSDMLTELHQQGKIERRRRQVGWFPVRSS
jgi:hypothetical protein